ncbi:MAG: hypothetical protein HOP13_11085 [Alphaproteobacteria bacterium]|nr:hypothetical protein [Alphaproteobacteria bacterium]
MLKLTQLAGFGAGGSVDVTPNPISFSDIFDAGVTASVATDVVTIAGINASITLRLTLTSSMSPSQTVDVYRSGAYVTTESSGTAIDIAIANNQTLQFVFTNAEDNTLWSGTATLANLSDANATLDTFAYTLQDTGSPGGGGGGGDPP